MEACDVLIIGGGPAGSSCARSLVKAGLNIIVLDKHDFPRDKVCAGWITPAVIDELDIDLNDYRKQHVCQEIRAFRTGTIHGPSIYNQYNHTVSYGIRRYEFDHYLLTRSGAKLVLGEPLKQLHRSNHLWVVNGNITAPMLVGAGGHSCPVARYLGAKIGKTEHSITAQEIEFKMTAKQAAACALDMDTPELFFYPDLSGYAWIFRKNNFLNIGVGRDSSENISHSARQFITYCKQQGKLPNNVPEKLKGHAYLLYDQSHRKVLDDGVLLIGDAAGLAYAESGEGIRPAVESGLMAADTILNAHRDYSAQNLEPYRDSLVHRFGKRHQQNSRIVSNVKHFLARRILTSRFLSRHILIDRFFLHRDQPSVQLTRHI